MEEPEVKKEKAEKKSTKSHNAPAPEKDNTPPKEKLEKVEEVVNDLPPQTSEPPLRPPIIGIPLRPSCAPDTNNSDWIFPLPLTLEELYSGTNYRFQITRQLKTPPGPDPHPASTPKSTSSSLDDEQSTSTTHVNVDIPPGGYKNHTQMRFEGLGNQRKSDGTFQDIVFVIQEVIHDRFIRIQDDLVARIELTWDEALQKEDVILVDGLDGEKVEVPIPRVPDDSKETRIPKAGMPTRNVMDEVVGRGDLVVRQVPSMSALSSKTDPLNVTQMGICFPPKAVELEMAGAEIQVQLAVAQSLGILSYRLLGFVWSYAGRTRMNESLRYLGGRALLVNSCSPNCNSLFLDP